RAHPAGHLRLPLRESFAPKWVRRHDVARAQGEAGLVEAVCEPFRQLREEPIDVLLRVIGMIGEYETVVLIRVKQALAAAGRAHHQHGEGDRRLTPPQFRHARNCLTQNRRGYTPTAVRLSWLTFY